MDEVHTRARRAGRLATILSTAAVLLAGVGAPVPAGAQNPDPTPNSDARLISETAAIQPGQPFTVGLHITLDEGWHTYWKNAGDAGNGAILEWELPEGFTVDSLRYPTPERIPYPPLLNYGYHDEVVLLAEVTPPADLDRERVTLAATADFLVCADVCIPASTEVDLRLPVRSGDPGTSSAASLIRTYRAQLPVESHEWSVRAARSDSGFVLAARPPASWTGSLAGAYFFPAEGTWLRHTQTQEAGLTEDGELLLQLPESEYLYEEPARLSGILAMAEGQSVDGSSRAIEVATDIETGGVAWAAADVEPLAQPAAQAAGGDPAGATSLSLLVALAFAFVGGLILNLMPCVFPILSLKALGFASRGGDRAGMRKDGLAFGAGVVLTFLAVAAALLAVRAGGAQVGWGYQLQSPAIVAALAALMFGIGLWLAGVVELGASLTRLGGVGAGKPEGQQSSFLTGVLATIVATPCTAPFMGAAIGAALIRPPVEALSIFAALGVGMAAPYVLLSFWPALAAKLPKPGRWMETFKQVLAFPMFAVAIWLVWVFGLQVGIGGAAQLLFGLLLLALAAWLIGRWPSTVATTRVRVITRGLAAVALVLAVVAGARAIESAEPITTGDSATAAIEWEPYSADVVDAHRQAGRPVFVDFTAAWCISCQVNERVALETRAVRQAFRDYDIATVKADWTRRDPEITEALASFGRAGVPLYVLYPADPAAEPRVLPELLTQKIVLDALRETLGEPDLQRQARADSEG